MTYFLEQEESIKFLNVVQVIPQKAYAKIYEEDNKKYILRQYKVNKINEMWDTINVSYILDIKTDRILSYSVYATSKETEDIISLCIYEKDIFKMLFYNILALEEDLWKYCLLEENSVKDIKIADYPNIMFESNKEADIILEELAYNKIFKSEILSQFTAFLNKNDVVPKNVWENVAN